MRKLSNDWNNIILYLGYKGLYEEVCKNTVELEKVVNRNDKRCWERWSGDSINKNVYYGELLKNGNYIWHRKEFDYVEYEDYDALYIVAFEVLYKGKQIFSKERLMAVLSDKFKAGDIIWQKNPHLNPISLDYGQILIDKIIEDYNITEEVLIKFINEAHKKQKKEKGPNFSTYWELYFSEFLDDFKKHDELSENSDKQYSLKK